MSARCGRPLASGRGTCTRRVLRAGGPCGISHTPTPAPAGRAANAPSATIADPFTTTNAPKLLTAASGKTHATTVGDYTICGVRTTRMDDSGPAGDIDQIGCLMCRGGLRHDPDQDPGAEVFAAAGAYPVRKALKEAGAVWQADTKSWLVTRRMLDTVQDAVLADGWAYFFRYEHPSHRPDAVFWKNITEWRPQRRSQSARRYRALMARRAELLRTV